MYLSEALDDFIESIDFELVRSKKTEENYTLYIVLFI